MMRLWVGSVSGILLKANTLVEAYIKDVLTESDLPTSQFPYVACGHSATYPVMEIMLIQPGKNGIKVVKQVEEHIWEDVSRSESQRIIVGVIDAALKEYYWEVNGRKRTLIRRDELRKALNLYLPQFGRFCGGVAKAWLHHTAAPQFAMLAGFCAAIVDIYSDPTILRGSLLELD